MSASFPKARTICEESVGKKLYFTEVFFFIKERYFIYVVILHGIQAV